MSLTSAGQGIEQLRHTAAFTLQFQWTMHGGTRRYMSKQDRPCDFCRARKSACHVDGGPPCRLCASRRRSCTFERSPPPRKLSRRAQSPNPSPFQGSLHLEQSVNGISQDTETESATLGGHQNNVSLPSPFLDPLTQVALANPFPDAFAPQAWEDLPWAVVVPPADSGDVGPSVVTPPTDAASSENVLDAENNLPPLCTGFTGDLEPYLSRHFRFDRYHQQGFRKLINLNLSNGFHDAPPFIRTEPSLYGSGRREAGHTEITTERLREDLEAIVSVDIGRRLVELYRLFIAPQYPIFSAACPLDAKTSRPELLAAVYAITQPFIRFDEYLSVEFVYKAPAYAELTQLAYRALQPQLHSPSLSTVQTLLLLVVRPSTDTSVSESPIKWTLLSTLVAVAHAIGLHYDLKPWNIAPWQIAQRRRISFLIYSVDKWLGCSLGRPPLLSPDNWLVTSLAPDDDLQAELTPKTWSCLLRYSSLTCIMDRVLRDLL